MIFERPSESEVTIRRLKKKLQRCRTKRAALARDFDTLNKYLRHAAWVRLRKGMEEFSAERLSFGSEREKLYAQIQELKAMLWDKKEVKP